MACVVSNDAQRLHRYTRVNGPLSTENAGYRGQLSFPPRTLRRVGVPIWAPAPRFEVLAERHAVDPSSLQLRKSRNIGRTSPFVRHGR